MCTHGSEQQPWALSLTFMGKKSKTKNLRDYIAITPALTDKPVDLFEVLFSHKYLVFNYFSYYNA